MLLLSFGPAHNYQVAAKRCTPAACAASGHCEVTLWRIDEGKAKLGQYLRPFRCVASHAEDCLRSSDCRTKGICRFARSQCFCMFSKQNLVLKDFHHCVYRPPTDAELRALQRGD